MLIRLKSSLIRLELEYTCWIELAVGNFYLLSHAPQQIQTQIYIYHVGMIFALLEVSRTNLGLAELSNLCKITPEVFHVVTYGL